MTTLTVTTTRTTPPRSATAGATIAILMTMIPPPPTTTIPTTTMRMDRVAEADRGAPLPLLIWLSPAFPVGAFAYSHGLEWAVEAGDVVDARSLETWLVDLLEFGAPRSA